jgi:nucleoside-diphosphate-sugar epimerase
MKKKALVTGATGFVGSNLVRGLLNNTWQVDVIARPSSSLEMLSGIEEKVGVHRFNGETASLLQIVADSKPSVVFHVASLFLSEHKAEQVEALIQSNVLFGTQLLEAMSKFGVCNLVNTSTSWEHFENKEYSPVNLYAATKKSFADMLQYYVDVKGIRAVTLKLFDTYGKSDPRPKLFHLLERIAQTKDPMAMSPGDQLIDLVYIDDVVNAFQIAAARLMAGQVSVSENYGVSSGNPIPLKMLVEIYEELIGVRLPIQWGGRPYREREVMKPWRYFATLPGWEPKTSIEEGIRMIMSERIVKQSKS